MLTRAEEEDLDERLRNWGRWAADHGRVGSTLLWRMMKLFGKPDENDLPCGRDEDDSDMPPVDSADAILVERAWRALAESPLRYHTAKWVVAAHFCYPYASRRMVCKRLHINRSDYDVLLKIAKYMIFNRIAYQASKRLSAGEA